MSLIATDQLHICVAYHFLLFSYAITDISRICLYLSGLNLPVQTGSVVGNWGLDEQLDSLIVWPDRTLPVPVAET